jgi:hypothetical protein
VHFTLGLVVVEVVVEDEVVEDVVVAVLVEDELEGMKVSVTVDEMAGNVSTVGAFSELNISGGALLISGIVDSATEVVSSSICFVSATPSEVSLVLAGRK